MNQGFFSVKEIKPVAKKVGKVLSCQTCGLDGNNSLSNGKFEKKILIILERPNESLGLLKKVLSDNGINLHNDCYITSAVQCYSNHLPTLLQVDCCRTNVKNIIATRKPKLIIVLGQFALYSVIGDRWKKDFGTIVKWRGFSIPDQDLQTWIFPTYSTTWVNEEKNKIEELIFEQDITNAIKLLKKDFPVQINPKIDIIESLEPLTKLLQMGNIPISFDYETTGLKPHAEGHRIICASVAYSQNHVYAFMIPSKRKELRPFIDLLESRSIGKIAHNIKYEDTWTAVRLNTIVNNWEWDTMQAAHILDNRPNIVGLKFQTYINFGVIDYASEISPYLEGDSKNGNSFNSITELTKTKQGKEKLLTYCAMDSIYEYRLAIKQQSIMGYEKNRF